MVPGERPGAVPGGPGMPEMYGGWLRERRKPESRGAARFEDVTDRVELDSSNDAVPSATTSCPSGRIGSAPLFDFKKDGRLTFYWPKQRRPKGRPTGFPAVGPTEPFRDVSAGRGWIYRPQNGRGKWRRQQRWLS